MSLRAIPSLKCGSAYKIALKAKTKSAQRETTRSVLPMLLLIMHRLIKKVHRRVPSRDQDTDAPTRRASQLGFQ